MKTATKKIEKVPFIKYPSKNERSLLEKIHRYDYVSSDTLRIIIPNKSYRHNFMKSLKSKGLVQDYLAMPRFIIWYLTDLGKSFTTHELGINIPYSFSLDNCDDEKFNHTSGLSCIEAKYDLLKKKDSSLKSFFCEKESIAFFEYERNAIKQKKTSFSRIPDSYFHFKEPGEDKIQTHAIELELFVKAKHRYFKIYHWVQLHIGTELPLKSKIFCAYLSTKVTADFMPIFFIRLTTRFSTHQKGGCLNCVEQKNHTHLTC
jgi:hypothetical protein